MPTTSVQSHLMEKSWRLKRPRLNDAETLGRELGISSLLAQVCLNRQLETPDAIREFLAPHPSQLHDPFGLHGMDKAIARLKQAQANNEMVMVFGDYDADGIMASSILTLGLNAIGIQTRTYIPNRFEDGYGLRMETLERINLSDISVLITVDCGINSRDAAAFLKENDIDFIVTDHHEPEEPVEDAVAVVHPRLGDDYAFGQLCGAAVALKVILALSQTPQYAKPLAGLINDLLVMAAVGTICDVMPLRDENRVLVSCGFQLAHNIQRPGLKALLDRSLRSGVINATAVGFQIGPRINAAGRMGKSHLAFKLFMTDCPDEAEEIVDQLDQYNSERQKTEHKIATQAVETISEEQAVSPTLGIVASGQDWHEGVIGIVASRLVDKFYLPSIVIAFDGDMGKGSCRSIEGFSMLEALQACHEHLEEFGGHEMAAGLRVRQDKLADFKSAYEAYCAQKLNDGKPPKTLAIDVAAHIDAIDMNVVEELDRLAPFGVENPAPTFAIKHVDVAGKPRTMKDGKHLSFMVRGQTKSFRAIAWNAGEYIDALESKTPFSIVYTPKINEFRGTKSVEFEVKDLRLEE